MFSNFAPHNSVLVVSFSRAIFCNECSNYYTQVASSKKPVRVCQPCHTELNSFRGRVRILLLFIEVYKIDDCAKDGGEEFFTEMHCVV